MRLVNPEFAAPVARIGRRVGDVLAVQLERDDSRMWKHAVGSVLALHQAPQHHLRSQLALLGSLAGGGAAGGAAIEQFAAGLELLHLFMLVHDDIIDNAQVRRGHPTVHVSLQRAEPGVGREPARHLAMVLGNCLQVLAMQQLAGAGRAFDLVLDACARTGIGQFEDIVASPESDRERFRRLMEDKSAYHSFAAPFAGGLLVANPNADPQPALAWGRTMGVALQAVDDLADLVGDPAETGKDNFRDLLEGRLSLALTILLERATDSERHLLEACFGAGSIAPSDRVEIEHLITSHCLVEHCASFVNSLLADAERLAGGFPLVRDGMSEIHRGLRETLQALERASRSLA